jgi:death-on-curing protein
VKYAAVRFLSVQAVVGIHDEVVRAYGGVEGVRDPDALEAVVREPEQTFGGVIFYPSLASVAARYTFGIAMEHPFVDGNKRTAIAAAAAFLRINGRKFHAAPVWEQRIIDVVTDAATREALVDWFVAAIGTDEPIEP